MSDWTAFCPKCSEEIDLPVTFLHQADGKKYTCPKCNTVLTAEYDEDIDSGDGFIRLKESNA